MAASILIVDDEEHVRSALRRSLRSEGYELIEAASGKEGLVVLKSRPVDVIISDHSMPEMTGIEFLKNARILRPDAVRIVLTGQADLAMAIKAINEDAVYRFLLKPWDGFDIKVLIKYALKHGAMVKENARLADLVRKHEQTIARLTRKSGGAAREDAGAWVIDEDEVR